MSATFEGVTTLQFTPDNKHAYAFSGEVSVPHTGTKTATLIEGATNSEYLIADFVFGAEATTDNLAWLVYLNDIKVISVVSREPYDFNLSGYEIIIPPFTTFKITGLNDGGVNTRIMTAALAAKVGMPQRVGN
jgi:hypothetical protein